MSVRASAVALAAVIASTALAPGLSFAQQKPAKAEPATGGVFVPSNIKRALVRLIKVSGATVQLRAPDGTSFTVVAFNPNLLLFKNYRIADAKEFKPGDPVIVYYNLPPTKGDIKLLWAATDPASEVMLAEMRAKPVEAKFKSFDPATSKLTVQTDGRAKTYTVATPIIARREMREATLGKPSTKDHPGYTAGDKLLLVLTADRKRVRMVTDAATYDRYAQGLKKFPIPPASKLGK